ncbi:MAG: hypothetical protein ACFCUI_04700 [Bernardetiaceae bacterium]
MLPENNEISIQFDPQDLQKIQAALQTIQETLMPYLIALAPEDRPALPRLTPRMRAFIERALELIAENPEYKPPFLDTEALKVDWQAVLQLEALRKPLQETLDYINDSEALSGNEAYFAALVFYNQIKHAARTNATGASLILKELENLYPGQHLPKK